MIWATIKRKRSWKGWAVVCKHGIQFGTISKTKRDAELFNYQLKCMERVIQVTITER